MRRLGAQAAPHDAAQGRVGLQCGRINADRLAFDQTRVSQSLQNPGEDGVMGLEINQAARARNRRMIRRRFRQHQSEKLAKRNESAARHAIARSASRPSK